MFSLIKVDDDNKEEKARVTQKKLGYSKIGAKRQVFKIIWKGYLPSPTEPLSSEKLRKHQN